MSNNEKTFAEQQAELENDLLNAEELPTANIMVAGKTGTGKSTLLNAVFGEDLATTGTGRPVTDHIDEYQQADIPIHIWDTVGLELDSQKTKDSIADIKKTIANKSSAGDKFDRMHAIWYCIASDGNRYEGAELEFIKELHSIGVPFIIVLTKCFGAKSKITEFENVIREANESMGMGDIEIVRVLAQDFLFEIDEDTVIPKKAFGLEELVNVTLEKLPDFIKSGFVAAQRVSKAEKRALCEDVIFEYVDTAQKGFWDKVPIINIFTTDSTIKKMFKRIGKLYNTDIPDEAIKKLNDELGGIDIENGFWGLISPVSIKYDQKVDDLFDKKNKEGYKEDYKKLPKNQRVARFLAFYGYTFLDSIEQLWSELTEEQLRDIDMVVRNLSGIIREKLKSRK